jgi:hypothetical protein
MAIVFYASDMHAVYMHGKDGFSPLTVLVRVHLNKFIRYGFFYWEISSI